MTEKARLWFAAFAAVGLLAGTAAAGLLWLLVVHPVRLLQASSGWPGL